jgi:hypothetical protein
MIYRGETLIAQNDDWGTPTTVAANQVIAPSAEIASAAESAAAFAFATGSKDAAILITLAPGTYTAQVTSTTSATGVALIENYELP